MSDLFADVEGVGGGSSSEVSLVGRLKRVIFRASESHYMVGVLEREGGDEVVLVGEMPGVEEGEELRVWGSWGRHRRFGVRFLVSSYQTLTPQTLEGMVRYLGSGIVPGIGRRMAQRIVDHFGWETFEVIEREPGRLCEVEGIGRCRAERIAREVGLRRRSQEAFIFLQGLGLGGRTLSRIYSKYRERVVSVLRSNPYILVEEVEQIGFRTADRIAFQLGLSPSSPERVEAGLRWILKEAMEGGGVCLGRDELLGRGEEVLGLGREELEGVFSRLLGGGGFVLEGDLVYLPYMHRIERLAYYQTLRLLRSDGEVLELRAVDLEGGYTARQREAIELAARAKVMVLTGGPGVGKTYTVMGIVDMFRRCGKRVALCAPTGRAAKRLQEATGLEAKTIHRLLRYQPGYGFGHHRGCPLEVDVVVVDESSMVDIVLYVRLLEALPSSCKVIFVGDKDQLPPVGPGRPFFDLIESGVVPVVYLERIFRQLEGSLIVENAHRVREGRMPLLECRRGIDFYFLERGSSGEVLRTLEELFLRCRRRGILDWGEVQVLTPMRRGELGYERLNVFLQGLLNPGGEVVGRLGGGVELRGGDRVLQVRNNYEKEVFNGDIGYVLGRGEGGVVVDFIGRRVEVGLEELDQIQLAYAISIHKSQGSEYPCVVIPLVRQHYVMLRRNLLYTGITRARRLVILVGERGALRLALERVEEEKRCGRFLELLRGLEVSDLDGMEVE